jgi:hypothetical protein
MKSIPLYAYHYALDARDIKDAWTEVPVQELEKSVMFIITNNCPKVIEFFIQANEPGLTACYDEGVIRTLERVVIDFSFSDIPVGALKIRKAQSDDITHGSILVTSFYKK